MPWKYSTTFLPYTIFAVNPPGSQQVGYELTTLPVINNHPYLQSWRSVDLQQTSITCRVGVPLIDPGFELNNLATGWGNVNGAAGGGDTATADNAVVHLGTRSLKIVCASGNTFGRYQKDIPVVPGVTYRFRAWVRVTARAAGTIQLDITDAVAARYLLRLPRTTVTGGGVFTQSTGTFTVPAGITFVRIYFYGDGTPNFTAYLDDVSLVPQVGTVAVFNANTPTLQIATSPDAFTYTFGAFMPVNRWWQYYRACWVQTPVIESEYIAIVTNTDLLTHNGASYWEIGTLCFLPPLTTFTGSPMRNMPETLTREYAKSGESVAAAGPWRIEQEWRMYVKPNRVDELHAFALISQAQPFLVYENNDLTEECGLYRYQDHLTFTRSVNNEYQLVNVKVKEMV